MNLEKVQRLVTVNAQATIENLNNREKELSTTNKVNYPFNLRSAFNYSRLAKANTQLLL